MRKEIINNDDDYIYLYINCSCIDFYMYDDYVEDIYRFCPMCEGSDSLIYEGKIGDYLANRSEESDLIGFMEAEEVYETMLRSPIHKTSDLIENDIDDYTKELFYKEWD